MTQTPLKHYSSIKLTNKGLDNSWLWLILTLISRPGVWWFSMRFSLQTDLKGREGMCDVHSPGAIPLKTSR